MSNQITLTQEELDEIINDRLAKQAEDNEYNNSRIEWAKKRYNNILQANTSIINKYDELKKEIALNHPLLSIDPIQSNELTINAEDVDNNIIWTAKLIDHKNRITIRHKDGYEFICFISERIITHRYNRDENKGYQYRVSSYPSYREKFYATAKKLMSAATLSVNEKIEKTKADSIKHNKINTCIDILKKRYEGKALTVKRADAYYKIGPNKYNYFDVIEVTFINKVRARFKPVTTAISGVVGPELYKINISECDQSKVLEVLTNNC